MADFDYGRYEKYIGRCHPAHRLFYGLSRFFFHGIYRMRVKSPENIPPTGGMLVCSNHLSFLDPPGIGCCFPYPLYYFARKTLMNHPASRWLLPRLNSIPIDQERSDLAGIRTTLRVLKAGGPVVAFPEGARSLDGKMQPAQPGIGMLIAKAAVPVLPVRLRGTYEALRRGSARLRIWPLELHIGKLIPAERFQDGAKGGEAYLRYSQLVMEEISKL